jgi:hypothetical protein
MFAGAVRKTTMHPRKDGHTGVRYEYFCGSYFKAIQAGQRQECKCLRNGVFQDTLEVYLRRYLDEAGKRLDLLTGGPEADHLTDRLVEQEGGAWRGYYDGIERLTGYLAQHHPEEYNEILREYATRQVEADEAGSSSSHAGATRSLVDLLGDRGRRAHEQHKDDETTPGGFVDACLAFYRSAFDPARLAAEVERLEAEHTALMGQWADLPTPRAKEKAREQFALLEARIEGLRRQQQDAASVVEQHYREIRDLQKAIADAKLAMQSKADERALRQRADALRAIVQRIECRFTATGQTGGGWGKKNARLVSVTIYPVGEGDPVAFSADSKGTLIYSSAHSCM